LNEKKAEILANVLLLIDEESERKRASAAANFSIWNWKDRDDYDFAVTRLKAWLTARMQTLDERINQL
jgi:hypothetical protein